MACLGKHFPRMKAGQKWDGELPLGVFEISPAWKRRRISSMSYQ